MGFTLDVLSQNLWSWCIYLNLKPSVDLPWNHRSECDFPWKGWRSDSITIYKPISGRGDLMGSGPRDQRDKQHWGGWGVREDKGRVFQSMEVSRVSYASERIGVREEMQSVCWIYKKSDFGKGHGWCRHVPKQGWYARSGPWFSKGWSVPSNATQHAFFGSAPFLGTASLEHSQCLQGLCWVRVWGTPWRVGQACVAHRAGSGRVPGSWHKQMSCLVPHLAW